MMHRSHDRCRSRQAAIHALSPPDLGCDPSRCLDPTWAVARSLQRHIMTLLSAQAGNLGSELTRPTGWCEDRFALTQANMHKVSLPVLQGMKLCSKTVPQ